VVFEKIEFARRADEKCWVIAVEYIFAERAAEFSEKPQKSRFGLAANDIFGFRLKLVLG
jgi:hypothetical protein